MAEPIQMQGEHQNFREMATTAPTGYEPDEKQKKAIKLTESCYERAKKHRKRFDDKWLDFYKMFRGKQWKEARPSYRHSEVINMVFKSIQALVPVLTDARQRFEYLPQDPSDFEFAKILDEVAEADWQKGNWTYKLAEIIYDGHFYGSGIGGMRFNPEANYGLGAMEFASEDVFYHFPAPDARDFNEECPYHVKAEPVTVEKIKKDYPEMGHFVKPDVLDLMEMGDRTDLVQARLKSPVDAKVIAEGSSPYDLRDQNKVIKITLRIKDDTVCEEEKKEINPDGSEALTYERRLQYPNGRKLVVAGGVLLEDGEFECADGLIPYAAYRNYIDPRSFWGISEVENLESPQRIFNKLLSFSLDVLTLMGNPIWVVDTSAGIDTDNLFNRPGMVVEKEPGSEVRREEGVQLQPYVLQLIDRMVKWFDDESGANDLTRGVKPEGVTAAAAINALQDAAQTRIRQKSRNLDAFLQNLGQLYKNGVMENYDTPRVIRVTGDQNATNYFKFHVEKREQPDGSTQNVAKVKKYAQDPATGAYHEPLESTEYLIRSDFDVKVSTGSVLPFAKAEKFNKAQAMFRDGVIDREEYLKAADYPNWEVVLARMQQAEAAQAQAQAAAQGQPGAPPPQAGGPPPAA